MPWSAWPVNKRRTRPKGAASPSTLTAERHDRSFWAPTSPPAENSSRRACSGGAGFSISMNNRKNPAKKPKPNKIIAVSVISSNPDANNLSNNKNAGHHHGKAGIDEVGPDGVGKQDL